jgi:hypothetical protein
MSAPQDPSDKKAGPSNTNTGRADLPSYEEAEPSNTNDPADLLPSYVEDEPSNTNDRADIPSYLSYLCGPDRIQMRDATTLPHLYTFVTTDPSHPVLQFEYRIYRGKYPHIDSRMDYDCIVPITGHRRHYGDLYNMNYQWNGKNTIEICPTL